MLASEEKHNLFFETVGILREMNIFNKQEQKMLFFVFDKILKKREVNKDSAFITIVFIDRIYSESLNKIQESGCDVEDLPNIIIDDESHGDVSSIDVRVFFLYRFLNEKFPEITEELKRVEKLPHKEMIKEINQKLKNS